MTPKDQDPKDRGVGYYTATSVKTSPAVRKYRRNIKVTGGEVQEASQGALSYTCAHPADRAQYHI